MCNRHYLQDRSRRLGTCSVDGCERTQHAKQLCGLHLARLNTHGDVGGADLEINRGSGRSITTDGYVRLHRPDHPMAQAYGWVLEHRMVAYDLGLLTGPEDNRHVHHTDGDKQNNDPGNLAVLTHEEHSRHHGADRAHDALPLVIAYGRSKQQQAGCSTRTQR